MAGRSGATITLSINAPAIGSLLRKVSRRVSSAWRALRGKQLWTRMYAAARASRLTGDWQAANTSADSELSSSLTQLRSRSRALCRDVSYAKRAKQLVVNNVIGTGIGMQGQVYTTRDELNARVNDEIESVWKEWCYADHCHTGGRLDFALFERALMAQVFEAGEVLVRKHYRRFGKSEIPFALELIEAERIADDMYTASFERGGRNEIRMGVEVDQFGRPIAYYIRRRHPGELRFTFNMMPDDIERVPADQIIHLAFGDRWPQTRGEPWMSAVIRTARDMAGYIEAEITRARTQASVPWTIETPEDITSFGEEQADGSVEMEVEPGIAKRLNPGETMNVPAIGSPNPQVEPFMRYLLRDFASGLGVSYASLSADYSQGNYSSSRLALLDDRDVWRAFQTWFLCSFRQPIHREWMQQAVLAGAFKTFSIESWALDRRKYEAVRFRPRGWGWVDPTKEVEAFKEAVRCGFMTLQDVVSQSGADIEEIFDQREKEIGLAAEAGLVLDTDPANEIKAEPEPDPPAEAPDEDEEDDEIGENRAWAAALNSLESALADSSLSNARTAATLQETCSGLRHAIAASNENTAARISEEAKRSRADVAETRKAIESSERAISRASDLVAWSQKASQDLRSEVRDGFASVTAVSVKQSAEIASLRDTQLRAAAIDQSNIATLPGEGSANSSPDKELREKVAMHSGNAPAIVAGTSK